MIFDVGRICIKLAGRDAGKKCVIVDTIDDTFVLVDGQTRRRKVNVLHLEPLKEVLDIKKGADTLAVAAAFEKINVAVVVEKKSKQTPARVKKQHTKHDKKDTKAKK